MLIDDKTKSTIEDNFFIIKMTYDKKDIKRRYYRFVQYTPARSYRNGFLLGEHKVFDLVTGECIGNKIDRVGNNIFKVTIYRNHPFDTYYTIYDYNMKALFKYKGNIFDFKSISDDRTIIIEGKINNLNTEKTAVIYNNKKQCFEEQYNRVRFIEETPDSIKILYYSDNESKVVKTEYTR